jgi:signal transduction histidine kinase
VRRPVGLRTAITLSFAGGALLLAATMAIGTYLVARGYLVEQRERTAARQAFVDASYLRDGLRTSGAEVSDVLGSASPPASSVVLVRRGDAWFSSSLDVGEDVLPRSLRRQVRAGSAAITWTAAPDGPSVVVGVPLPAVDAEFYEITSTTELEQTLSTQRRVLAGFALAIALAGAALGRAAARRVVAPLDEVAAAAAHIAGGELDTRLPVTEDPDLATIVGSFNSMVDAVNDRIERDARFASDVSHELRSPLTALVTSVEILEGRRQELSERSGRVLDLVNRDLARFQRALQDLLELGRLEAGSARQVTRKVDARELVRHALQDSGRPTSLLGHGDDERDGELPVAVDKLQLNRALVNLFENADGHGDGLAAVTVFRDADSVFVSVEDDGPGVPPEEREHIFDRFARGGARGSHPGTGLGLSIVAETARRHDGAVWVSDRPAGGARFVLRLPADDADVPADEDRESDRDDAWSAR